MSRAFCFKENIGVNFCLRIPFPLRGLVSPHCLESQSLGAMKHVWIVVLLFVVSCSSQVRTAQNLSTPPKDLPFVVVWQNQYPDLRGTYFVNAMVGWVVGERGGILATADGGKTWNPQMSRTSNWLDAVHFANETTGWAVGADGLILATTNGGQTWVAQTSGVKEFLRSVHFVNATTGWIAGGNKAGLLLSTTDGGKTWIRQTSGVTESLRSLHFVDTATGWVVGGAGGLLSTRDGGKTWTKQRIEINLPLSSVYFINATTGWASYWTGLLSTTDGGKTWKNYKSDVGWYFQSLQFADANRGWAVGEGGAILSTIDGGKTWSQQKTKGGPDLNALHMVNATTGWAVGDYGVIYATTDGVTWRRQNTGMDLPTLSVHFVDTTKGWGLGPNGDILATTDGGKTWTRQASPANVKLRSIHFVNPTTGWGVNRGGLTFSTTDGGKTWTPQTNLADGSFESVHFVDAERGWAVGAKGAVLATTDGGKKWKSQKGQVTSTLHSVYFADAKLGWAVGSDGVVLSTTDGGNTWEIRQKSNYRVNLTQVYFVNATTGWAIGTEYDSEETYGLILSTTDGGSTWDRQVTSIEEHPTTVYFANEGWLVGITSLESGDQLTTLYRGKPVNYGPFVSGWQVSEDALTGINLKWVAQDERPEQVECVAAEFRPGKKADWGRIDISRNLAADGKGEFELSWNPKEYSISEGTDIYYRITLRDGDGLTFAHGIPDSFVYRPWWSRQPEAVRGMIIGVGFIAAYLAVGFALLWVFPLSLLWLHDRFPLTDLFAALGPGKVVAMFANAFLKSSGLTFFATHPRSRRAWAARYRSGQGSFNDLSPTIRASFIQDADCLDAWIERRAEQAEEALGRIESVNQRRVYIDLPVRVGKREEGQQLSEPKQTDLRVLLERPCAVLAIIGEGGTGKSTLACQIAFWAIASDPKLRVAHYRLIPVFIEDETQDLVGSVTGLLRQMVGPEEIETDIVANLLRHKRLLVIVDGLSERSLPTQRHIESVHQTASVNAMVVTTRHPPDFGPTPTISLWPEKVTVETLFYFLTEYLRRTGADELFPGRQALQMGDRLLAAVEGGSKRLVATPLLIKLFVDQAIELRKRGEPLGHLPVSIAETMLEHLRRTNPQDSQTPNYVSNDVIIQAARVLGRCSLGDDYVPRDFFQDAAQKALDEHGLRAGQANLIGRLAENGVIEERDRGGTKILRFSLDTVAEYMTALYWLDRLRDNASEWQAWLAHLRSVDGYPDRIRGFVVALEDCVLTYQHDFHVPDVGLADH